MENLAGKARFLPTVTVRVGDRDLQLKRICGRSLIWGMWGLVIVQVLVLMDLEKPNVKLCASVALIVVGTAIASNGTEIGIQLSGLGTRWFRAPAPLPDGWSLSTDDARGSEAGAVVGDGPLLEAMGLGASALPGATAAWGLLGVDQPLAFELAEHVREVTVGEHFVLRVPALDHGARLGIDIRKAVEKNTVMGFGATIPHREAGHVPLGQALARLPWSCFVAALEAFAADRGIQ